MSDTGSPADDGPDPQALRAALRAKIAKVKAEQSRLVAIEAGLDRAREQQWQIREKLATAETALRDAVRDEPQRKAYAYVNQSDEVSPVATAEEAVAVARAELDELESIENALSGEITRAQDNLRQGRSRIAEAAAAVVTNDDAYIIGLVAAHRKTWRKLRTIRAALEVVGEAVLLPMQYRDEARRVEPLDERREYGLDRDFVEEWRLALHQLLSVSADTVLPSMDDGDSGPPAPPPPARNGKHPNGHAAKGK